VTPELSGGPSGFPFINFDDGGLSGGPAEYRRSMTPSRAVLADGRRWVAGRVRTVQKERHPC
jgi:hypothetical protein